MSHDPQVSMKRLEQKLTHIRDKRLLPPDLLDLLEGVSRLQMDALKDVTLMLPNAADCTPTDMVLQGKPLLEREQFPIDHENALKLFGKLLELACSAGDSLAEAARGLREEIEAGTVDPKTLFPMVLSHGDFFENWGEKWPEAPRTAYFLAYCAIAPSILTAVEQLAQRLPAIETWMHPACPICGGLPLISILRKKEGFRYVTCSFCNHEYRVRRLACPICSEDDQKKLTFFTVKEEPGFRVDVCKSCNHYIKTIDFRELDRTDLPEFDDLDSMALDFVARKQGYTRATLSAWGF